jgi:4-hydroxy-3-methylbut-2-enyl diphosphate reductase
MKLLILAPRGFCAGVEMAVQALERALELFGPPIFVYHQIVHNAHVISSFSRRGVTFVESLDEVPEGAVLLYSAHGVSPEVRSEGERKKLTVIDATCPLVLKVHNEARRFADRGATVVVVGHAGHDEVIGVLGEVPFQSVLVGSPEDVDAVSIAPGAPIAYVTQTTLSLVETQATIDRLRQRFPHIHQPPRKDICYATENRQNAVRAVAGEADLVLVVGSENSSNTNRLAEAARESGARAYRIDSPDEIDFQWFENVNVCAVTAGASVPEDIVRSTIDVLVERLGIQEIEQRELLIETQRFSLPAVSPPPPRGSIEM